MAILQNTTVSGSLVITGDLTARQFILSSSVTFYTESFASGSTRFGDSADDIMRITGSLMMSSSLGVSLYVSGSTGNVGIGTTVPYNFGLSTMRTLHVEGSTYGTVISKSGTVGTFLIADSSAANAGAVGTYTNHDFTITTNNTERMRVTSAGNLQVTGSSTFSNSVTATQGNFFQTAASGFAINLRNRNANQQWAQVVDVNAVDDKYFGLYDVTNSAYRMVVTNGGDLGVGTSTIYYASGGRRVLEINGSGNSFLAFKVGDVAKSYFFQTGANFIITNLAAAGGYLALENNGGEKMRIASGGQILMHSTTYNSANIGQLFGNEGQAYFTVDGGQSLFLNRLTSDGVILDFQKNTVSVGTVSTNANSLPSDFNFKKNINTLDLGLNLVTKLRSVSYNLKIDDDDAALSTGFIAQEMEQSLTELGVNKNEYYILQHKPNEDEKQSQYWLDYSKLIPVLVKSIQELKAENDSLKEILTRNNIA
jgi:hypothetical protein